MVGFDDQVEFLVDPPTSDVQRALAAFDAPGRRLRIERCRSPRPNRRRKYLPLRTAQRREIVLVVVTDEAGDDAKIVDELVEPLRKNAIPVYVIGCRRHGGR